jgi:hypothetical protein
MGAQHVSGSRDTAYVSDLTAAHPGGAHVVLNTLTSPGMVSSAASLLRVGGRFVEIGKRDVTSAARMAQERPDVGYGLLAIDFLPPEVLGGLMLRVSSRLAAGESSWNAELPHLKCLLTPCTSSQALSSQSSPLQTAWVPCVINVLRS